MSRYYTADIKLSEEGDFELDEGHDIKLARGTELVDQMVRIPLKTSNPDWFGEQIAADLEDLIGLPNTRETGNLGKQKIIDSLVNTGFFDRQDLYAEAKPVGDYSIVFFLFINTPFQELPMTYRIEVDLTSGAVVRRVS